MRRKYDPSKSPLAALWRVLEVSAANDTVCDEGDAILAERAAADREALEALAADWSAPRVPADMRPTTPAPARTGCCYGETCERCLESAARPWASVTGGAR